MAFFLSFSFSLFTSVFPSLFFVLSYTTRVLSLESHKREELRKKKEESEESEESGQTRSLLFLLLLLSLSFSLFLSISCLLMFVVASLKVLPSCVFKRSRRLRGRKRGQKKSQESGRRVKMGGDQTKSEEKSSHPESSFFLLLACSFSLHFRRISSLSLAPSNTNRIAEGWRKEKMEKRKEDGVKVKISSS